MFQRFFNSGRSIFLTLLGVGLVVVHGWLVYQADDFAHHLRGDQKPVLWLVAGLLLSGALYLGIVALTLKQAPIKTGLIAFLVAGAIMRLSYMGSVPMLEDDHYRYLWEGATLAEGVNPYTYSINEVWQAKHATLPEHPKSETLSHLAKEGATVMQGANYKTLRSVYPLTAQAGFALGYIIKPFSLDAFRLVLFLAEIATISLIIWLLALLQKPIQWCLIYWLNPLIIKEIINSAHVDAIATPFIMITILGVIKQRRYLAGLALGIAAGVKLWPFMLFAPLWRRSGYTIKNLLLLLLISLGCLGVYTGAVYLGWQSHGTPWDVYAKHLGFVAYAKKWEMNDGLYMGFMWIASLLSDDFYIKHRIARWIMGAILLLTIAWRIWVTWGTQRTKEVIESKGQVFVADCYWIVLVLFLISPTQFPWYFCWVLPFVCFMPRWSALSLSVLLGIYYARFHFQHHGMVESFDYGWVWVQYIPVLVLIFFEWIGVLPTKRVKGKKQCAQSE